MHPDRDARPGASGDELLPAVYHELRRLAASKLSRERAAHTLQPTALVHEAWLRLCKTPDTPWANKAHFFASAAEAMRRILIDRARRRHAIRNGGGLVRLNIDDIETGTVPEDDELLLALNTALERLEIQHPDKARIVKLRFFGGLTLLQVADALEISEPTAKRWWSFARAWLFNEMRKH